MERKTRDERIKILLNVEKGKERKKCDQYVVNCGSSLAFRLVVCFLGERGEVIFLEKRLFEAQHTPKHIETRPVGRSYYCRFPLSLGILVSLIKI